MFEHKFIGLMRWEDRERYRDEMIDWLLDLNLPHFLTFNANRQCSIEVIHDKVCEWVTRVDHAILGRNWQKKGARRGLLVGFIERPDRNIHLHAMVRYADSFKTLSSDRQAAIWEKLMRGGSLDIQLSRNRTAVAEYITKVLGDQRMFESFFISQGGAAPSY